MKLSFFFSLCLWFPLSCSTTEDEIRISPDGVALNEDDTPHTLGGDHVLTNSHVHLTSSSKRRRKLSSSETDAQHLYDVAESLRNSLLTRQASDLEKRSNGAASARLLEAAEAIRNYRAASSFGEEGGRGAADATAALARMFEVGWDGSKDIVSISHVEVDSIDAVGSLTDHLVRMLEGKRAAQRFKQAAEGSRKHKQQQQQQQQQQQSGKSTEGKHLSSTSFSSILSTLWNDWIGASVQGINEIKASQEGTSFQHNDAASSFTQLAFTHFLPEPFHTVVKTIFFALSKSSISSSISGSTDNHHIQEHTQSYSSLAKIESSIQSDIFEAARLYQLAASYGNASAQFTVGVMHVHGLFGVEQSETLALLNFYYAALNGNEEAQVALSHRHSMGYGVPRSCPASVLYLTESARKASAVSLSSFGIDAYRSQPHINDRLSEEALYSFAGLLSGISSDDASGSGGGGGGGGGAESHLVGYWHNMASRGDKSAPVALGFLYLLGQRGVQQDFTEAAEHFAIAAEHNDTISTALLGFLYLHGLGVPQDYSTAEAFLKLAADANVGLAFNALGYMRWHGLGSTGAADHEQALQYFKLATESKGGIGVPHMDAFYNMAMMYIRGFNASVGSEAATAPETEASIVDKVTKVAQAALSASLAAGNSATVAAEHAALAAQQVFEASKNAQQANLGSAAAAAVTPPPFGTPPTPKNGEGVSTPDAAAAQPVLSHGNQNQGRFVRVHDFKIATSYLRQAAAFGHVPALVKLGQMQARGIGTPRDCNSAFNSLRKAVLKGDPHLQRSIPNGYRLLASGNTPASLLEYTRAAELGVEVAIWNAAFLLHQGLVPEVAASLSLSSRLLANNNTTSISSNFDDEEEPSLAHKFNVDYEDARWYEVAAAMGDAEAQFKLARCIEHGWGKQANVDTLIREVSLAHVQALSEHAFSFRALRIFLSSPSIRDAVYNESRGLSASSLAAEGRELMMRSRATVLASIWRTLDYTNVSHLLHQAHKYELRIREALQWYDRSATQGHAEALTASNRITMSLITAKKNLYASGVLEEDSSPSGSSIATIALPGGKKVIYGEVLVNLCKSVLEDVEMESLLAVQSIKIVEQEPIISTTTPSSLSFVTLTPSQDTLDVLIEQQKRAFRLFSLSASQGNWYASLKIGDYHYNGQGSVTMSSETAAEHYRIACTHHMHQACFNLGWQHERGDGVPLDVHLAKRYYDLTLEEQKSVIASQGALGHSLVSPIPVRFLLLRMASRDTLKRLRNVIIVPILRLVGLGARNSTVLRMVDFALGLPPTSLSSVSSSKGSSSPEEDEPKKGKGSAEVKSSTTTPAATSQQTAQHTTPSSSSSPSASIRTDPEGVDPYTTQSGDASTQTVSVNPKARVESALKRLHQARELRSRSNAEHLWGNGYTAISEGVSVILSSTEDVIAKAERGAHRFLEVTGVNAISRSVVGYPVSVEGEEDRALIVVLIFAILSIGQVLRVLRAQRGRFL